MSFKAVITIAVIVAALVAIGVVADLVRRRRRHHRTAARPDDIYPLW